MAKAFGVASSPRRPLPKIRIVMERATIVRCAGITFEVKDRFGEPPKPTRQRRVLPRISAETAPNAFGATAERLGIARRLQPL
jgi:hypothetical protein